MAGPTINYQTVPVRGRYVGLDGVPVDGRLVFTARAAVLTDAAALTTIIGRPLSVMLDETGAAEIALPATDDPDIVPNGFTYTVREDFTGGRTYDITVPLAASVSGIELATVAPAPADPGEAATYVTLAAHTALAERVTLVESDVSELDGGLSTVVLDLADVETTLATVDSRLDALEAQPAVLVVAAEGDVPPGTPVGTLVVVYPGA